MGFSQPCFLCIQFIDTHYHSFQRCIYGINTRLLRDELIKRLNHYTPLTLTDENFLYCNTDGNMPVMTNYILVASNYCMHKTHMKKFYNRDSLTSIDESYHMFKGIIKQRIYCDHKRLL